MMISICMIVKDEEKYIEECLQALKPLGYEIVVVDTGSTDKTRELAARYTNKIYDFPWINDFSAARNFSIEKAENDNILAIDSDEILVSFDKRELEQLIQKHPKKIGRIIRINEFTRDGKTLRGYERVSRLFDRRYYQYEGIIHEQLVSKSGEEKQFYSVPLTAQHYGYEGNLEVRRKKTERNIRLLEKQLVKEKTEAEEKVPYTLYQLGKSYYMQEDYEKANTYFSEGLYYDLDPKLEYVQDMVETYGYSLLETRDYETAWGLLGVYEEFSSSTDFVFLCGLIYMNNGHFTEAIQEFEKAAARKSFKMEGVNGCLAWYNIGVIYECLGEKKKAQEYYRKCGEYEPALERLERLG
ncbi:MAG: glycosyltransferase [Acetivibrio ethanolgignens]